MRKSVEWFANTMEQVLALHDCEKGEHGWAKMTSVNEIVSLWRHLQSEVGEAGKMLDKGLTAEFDAELAIKELVDIANMAMMVAENINCGLNPVPMDQFKQPQ